MSNEAPPPARVPAAIRVGPRRLTRRFAWMLAAAGTIGLCASLLWNLHGLQAALRDEALARARSSLTEDDLYRRWNADHGGLYVALTDGERARGDVHVVGHEIVLPSRRRLELVHHIGMTRLVHASTRGAGLELHGHVTSLNPTAERNAPDPWERDALRRLARGASEVSGVSRLDGREQMRVMRPLRTDEHCMQCHSTQGYEVGDLRGGIVFSVALGSLSGPGTNRRRDLVLAAHEGAVPATESIEAAYVT